MVCDIYPGPLEKRIEGCFLVEKERDQIDKRFGSGVPPLIWYRRE